MIRTAGPMNRRAASEHSGDAGASQSEDQCELGRTGPGHEIAGSEDASELAPIEPVSLPNHLALHQRDVRGRAADRSPTERREDADHRPQVGRLPGLCHRAIVGAQLCGDAVVRAFAPCDERSREAADKPIEAAIDAHRQPESAAGFQCDESVQRGAQRADGVNGVVVAQLESCHHVELRPGRRWRWPFRRQCPPSIGARCADA